MSCTRRTMMSPSGGGAPQGVSEAGSIRDLVNTIGRALQSAGLAHITVNEQGNVTEFDATLGSSGQLKITGRIEGQSFSQEFLTVG